MMQFLALQGGAAGAAIFRREQAQTRTGSVNSQTSTRLSRYKEHWNFYLGAQWSVSRENNQLVTANYCRPIVNKKASWLVGKGMITSVPTALQQVTKPVIDRVWKENGGDARLLEMALFGGINGDVDVLVTSVPPTRQELRLNPRAPYKTKIRVLDPASVTTAWDPLDSSKLTSVRIVNEINRSLVPANEQYRLPPVRSQEEARAQVVRYVETITADYIDEGYEGGETLRRANDLGEIPYVHWPNEMVPGEFYGLSDLDGLIDLQRELNEKLTDVSDIVHFHAAPITIISGAKAKHLEKGSNNLWSGLPVDAKVYNLELGSDLPASHAYVDKVREMMMDIAGIPEGSLGRLQSISNTSAAALEVQFQPLIEGTNRKRPNYQQGVQRINYFIVRIEQLRKRTAYPIDLCRSCGGRIVQFKVKGLDGQERIKKKCYMIDPQTLDFMSPDQVKVSVVIEHSFGTEVRKMPYAQAKLMWGKESPSYWDPAPAQDKEEKARVEEEKATAAQDKVAADAEATQQLDHERQLEKVAAAKKEVP